MKRFPILLVTLSLLLSIGLISCGGDDDGGGPVGPTLTAPQNLIVSDISANSVSLEWDQDEQYLSGFRVLRADGEGAYAQIEELEEIETSFIDTDLNEGTDYRYQVKGYTFNAESPAAEVTATTNPVTPSDLQAAKLSGTSIELNWSDNSEVEEGYEVQRSLRSNAGYDTVATLAADAITYVDEELTNNTQYYYRVRAILGEAFSDFSMVANATTTVPWPNAPGNLTAETFTDTDIQLNWVDRSFNELGFIVEVSLSEDGEWVFADSVSRNTSGNIRHTISQLQSQTMFYFRVYAFNDSGASALSNVASAETEPGPPLPPSDLVGESPNSRVVILDWADNSNDEAGFTLQKKLSDASSWSTLVELGSDVVHYQDSVVIQRTSYNYRIACFNDYGASSYSNIIEVTTPEGPPSAPISLEAIARSQSEIALTWRDMSNNEIGFHIEMSMNGEDGWELNFDGEPGVNNHIVTELAGETTYYFRVTAYNERGDSNPTNVAFATTWPAPPAAPTELVGRAPNSSVVNLSWTDNADNEAGFLIQKQHDNDGWLSAAELEADITSFNDEVVQPTWTYMYRLRAQNEGGGSDWSNVITVDVPNGPPLVPGNLQATAQGLSVIQVVWQDRAATESGYIIERRVAGEGDFSFLFVAAENASLYVDEGLEMETTYEYRVKAYTENGDFESEYSIVASATTWDLMAFEDDFEDYQVNTVPNNPAYTVNLGAPSTLLVTNEDVHGGAQSLKFDDSSDSETAYAQLIINHEKVVAGEVSMWVKVAANSLFAIIGGDASNDASFQIRFLPDGTLAYLDNDQFYQGPQYAFDRWINIQFIFNSLTKSYSFLIDGTPVASDLELYSSDESGTCALIFTCYQGENAVCPYAFVDDIVITHTEQEAGFVGASRSRRSNTAIKATDIRVHK